MSRFYFLQLVLFSATVINSQTFWYQPEQVHLAYGDNIFEVVVTWSTFNDTKESVVEYGIRGMVLRQEGISKLFVDGGELKRSQYIHRVTLKNLTPNSRYGKLCNKSINFIV